MCGKAAFLFGLVLSLTQSRRGAKACTPKPWPDEGGTAGSALLVLFDSMVLAVGCWMLVVGCSSLRLAQATNRGMSARGRLGKRCNRRCTQMDDEPEELGLAMDSGPAGLSASMSRWLSAWSDSSRNRPGRPFPMAKAMVICVHLRASAVSRNGLWRFCRGRLRFVARRRYWGRRRPVRFHARRPGAPGGCGCCG